MREEISGEIFITTQLLPFIEITLNEYVVCKIQDILFDAPVISAMMIEFRSHIYINGLVQDCSNTIANALELLQSCTKPSIYSDHQVSSLLVQEWHGKDEFLACHAV